MSALPALSWFGTILQVGGAALLATRWSSPPVAYKVMLAGAAIWLVLASIAANWPLAAMQLGFCVLNTIGLVRWSK